MCSILYDDNWNGVKYPGTVWSILNVWPADKMKICNYLITQMPKISEISHACRIRQSTEELVRNYPPTSLSCLRHSTFSSRVITILVVKAFVIVGITVSLSNLRTSRLHSRRNPEAWYTRLTARPKVNVIIHYSLFIILCIGLLTCYVFSM